MAGAHRAGEVVSDWSAATDNDLYASLVQAAVDDTHIIDTVMAQLGSYDVEANQRAYDMRASALHYATRFDWPVFPLQPGDKRPATRHGFKDATRDPAQISLWWTEMPAANIGTPTGHLAQGGCGYDVIDVDRDTSWADPEIGFASWQRMLHAGCPDDCLERNPFCNGDGSLHIRARAVTPRGGRHYYVPASGARNGSHVAPGIDIRGDGGYVALPPSVSAEHARRYTWLQRPGQVSS